MLPCLHDKLRFAGAAYGPREGPEPLIPRFKSPFLFSTVSLEASMPFVYGVLRALYSQKHE